MARTARTVGAVFLAARPGARQITGMLASLVGVGCAVPPGSEGDAAALLVADGRNMVATLFFATHTVFGRRACAGGSLLAALTGAMGYGLFASAPFAAAELVVSGRPTLTPSGAAALIYLGAGCSAAAYVPWGDGLRRLPAGPVALIGNPKLVGGLAVAAALAGEAFAPVQFAGAGLVLAGIWFGTATNHSGWSPGVSVRPGRGGAVRGGLMGGASTSPSTRFTQ